MTNLPYDNSPEDFSEYNICVNCQNKEKCSKKLSDTYHCPNFKERTDGQPLLAKTKIQQVENTKRTQQKTVLTKTEPDEESLRVLTDPKLVYRIVDEEIPKKIVGERESCLVILLCALGGQLVENANITSFNLLVNDDAGTGKDYIVGAVLELLPPEKYVKRTRISATVFTYWHNPKYEPDWTWDGKTFYNEDISEAVLNSDVFKVMCSKGSNATVVIKQIAVDINIPGKPIMIITTANATPNPELTRRFVMLNLDGSEKQTKAIMRRHSEFKQAGIVPEYNSKYQKAFTFLKRKNVKIPYALLIDEHFPTKNIMMRTNYSRFLDYIAASAALHQYQRQIDSEGFVLAQDEDYDLARECFLKLCSNKYMIALTINQKKILAIFEADPELKGSLTQLYTRMSFLTLRALQTNLQNLVKYGLLETEEATDNLNRSMTVYKIAESYKPNESINIPTFKELTTTTTAPSLTTTTTITTITPTTISKIENKFNTDIVDVVDVEAGNGTAGCSK